MSAFAPSALGNRPGVPYTYNDNIGAPAPRDTHTTALSYDYDTPNQPFVTTYVSVSCLPSTTSTKSPNYYGHR